MSAWLIDLIAGFQLGPLALEGERSTTPGQQGTGQPGQEHSLLPAARHEQRLLRGWANILAEGIDTFNGDIFPHGEVDRLRPLRPGPPRLQGDLQHHARAQRVRVVSPTWTAEKVDTDTSSVVASFSGAGSLTRTTVSDRSWGGGRFSLHRHRGRPRAHLAVRPNVVFDLVGRGCLPAMRWNTAEVLNGVLTRRTANDAYQAAMRVRLAF